MGKSRQSRPGPAATPFHNPFGGIAERLGITPAAPAPAPAAEARPATAAPARAVIRLERKGRGGKEATVVEKLELPPRELGAWLLDLKRALGCGGTVEERALVLHGDQRQRVRTWLEARGVRRISVG